MGADLFESYVDSTIAVMALGAVATGVLGDYITHTFNTQANAIFSLLLLVSLGIFASLLGSVFVRVGKGANIYTTMRNGLVGATALMAVLGWVAVEMFCKNFTPWYAMLAGLLAGATATGFLLAITLANGGGAMDNAKNI